MCGLSTAETRQRLGVAESDGGPVCRKGQPARDTGEGARGKEAGRAAGQSGQRWGRKGQGRRRKMMPTGAPRDRGGGGGSPSSLRQEVLHKETPRSPGWVGAAGKRLRTRNPGWGTAGSARTLAGSPRPPAGSPKTLAVTLFLNCLLPQAIHLLAVGRVHETQGEGQM